jgi:hydroxyethylthiazole kinase
LAVQEDTVVVVSRETDIVTDGEQISRIDNGHPLMGQVVGTGCVLGSTLGVFCGVADDYFEASLKAVAAFGIAGEKAAEEASRPASYKVAFQDNISELTPQEVEAEQNITTE